MISRDGNRRMGVSDCNDGTYLGEVSQVAGILVSDISVIGAWYFSFGLDAEEGVFESMN